MGRGPLGSRWQEGMGREQEVGCACSWSNSIWWLRFHLGSFTNETSHGLLMSENRHTRSITQHTQELSASHSFTHCPRLTSSVTLTAHMQSDPNNIHTFFYRKTHLIHACQLQAPSRRHKQRANGIKPSAQHFHQHKTTVSLKSWDSVWKSEGWVH